MSECKFVKIVCFGLISFKMPKTSSSEKCEGWDLNLKQSTIKYFKFINFIKFDFESLLQSLMYAELLNI